MMPVAESPLTYRANLVKEMMLRYAREDIPVFPLAAGSKVPPAGSSGHLDAIAGQSAKPIIMGWVESSPDMNWGARGGSKRTNPQTGEAEVLAWVDLDRKHGKDGLAFLAKACAALGIKLEDHNTLTVETPTGGLHLGYWFPAPGPRHGEDVLGPGSGVDVRTEKGYVVGPESTINGRAYRIAKGCDVPIACAGRLAELFPTGSPAPGPANAEPLPGVDATRADARALDYLRTAPAALEGQGGDGATYAVACQLKDTGCTEAQALALLSEHWNPRCLPPWDEDELAAKVAHAFKYGKDAPGCAAPEAVFPVVDAPPAEGVAETKGHPFAEMNKEYAFTPAGGGHIIHETTDPAGRFALRHLDLQTFHADHANQPFQIGDAKPKAISKCWMEWAGRRKYDGFVFAPEQDRGPRWYNLWRGFAVTPAPGPAKHPALDAFLEHARLNVCDGNPQLFRWLIGFFAHLVQRPWEKPLVALVFKGKKGTGKNALVERVGVLLGPHFLVADNDRYLLSQFNGHLENCLFMVLDEATWAGDKKAEGRLKGIITGTEHIIEQKGREPYRVANLTRIAILGNEDWIVPTSQDERRFAVFNVGDGRRQDRKFFQDMREGMEAGGYAHLLRYLLDFDLAGVEVNEAPNTQGLVDQKLASLRGPERWLADVLAAGEISGGVFGAQKWDEDGLIIAKAAAYDHYVMKSKRNYGEFRPVDDSHFWPMVQALVKVGLPRLWETDGNRKVQVRKAVFPPLKEARKAFAAALGGVVNWNDQEDPDIFG